ncbi:MAG: hypothetical protein GX282_03675 [Campylobacteraceae bacterium]|nr:hypothetical protein [Campylobacteraceae bacterium]
MSKLFRSENQLFLLAFLLNLLLLLYAISNLSISYDEAEIYFNKQGLVGFITQISCAIFGQNDFALRLPFLLIHLANAILVFKVSKIMLKSRLDRLMSATIYMFLPGVMASAILVNEAGIILFFTLLFLYFHEIKSKSLALLVLAVTLLIDRSFSTLYLGVFFYATFYKNKRLSLVSGVLFILSLIIYDFDVGGKPKGYFLDTIGVYAAVFSPFVFMFFIYAVYRVWVKERKNLLWFIVVVSFCLSSLLSFRQRVELEEFLPYTVIAIPLMVKVFFTSYRVRLPRFRKKYNVLALFLFITLSSYSVFVIFNQAFYPLIFRDKPEKHFIYDYDIAKELANELKSRGLDKVIMLDDELELRLKFYGIEKGGSHILTDEEILLEHERIEIYSFGTLKARYYLY